MTIGNTIKAKRLQKGMTQEELALKSDITIRTVQRIESGEVDPRSFTLQAIASALEIDYNELVSADELSKVEGIASNDTFWLAILHFSGIVILIIPSVIIWTLKKDKIPDIRNHAIDVINFQLSMMLYLIFTAFLCLIPKMVAFSPTVKIPVFLAVGILLFTLQGIYISTMVIINSARAANNQPCRYLFCLAFLKKR